MISIDTLTVADKPLTPAELAALSRLSRNTFHPDYARPGRYGWQIVTDEQREDAQFLIEQGILRQHENAAEWTTLTSAGVARAQVTPMQRPPLYITPEDGADVSS